MQLLIAILLTALALISPQSQITPGDDTCQSVRTLMVEGITPYDRPLGGGTIAPQQMIGREIPADVYADSWSFTVTRPQNDSGTPVDSAVVVLFDSVTIDLNLEANLFAGMDAVGPYVPVTVGTELRFPLLRDGAHTLIVRRTDPVDRAGGRYAFRADFPGTAEVDRFALRDNTTGLSQVAPPALVDGRMLIDLEAADFHAHPGAVASVASHNGTAAQVRFDPSGNQYGVLVNAWADNVWLIGGDLAVSGSIDDHRRIFYLEDYGYQVDLQDGDLTSVVDGNGLRWRINWTVIDGVWITQTCAGFRLTDGRTFTGTLAPGQRAVTFTGDLGDFEIQINSQRADGSVVNQRLNMDWDGIRPLSETRWHNGVLRANLIGDRSISLDAVDLSMFREPVGGEQAVHVPLEIELRDRDAFIVLDWINLGRFSLIDDLMTLTFLDEPRTSTSRSSENLERLEALNDVVWIVYKANGEPGPQYLLLPASESYLEIVTPAGQPEFDGMARPGEPGYGPRGLNNLGGECYPFNTIQDAVNCPPNGHPNPANGNLWYAVTDLRAHGYRVDLALTRSYNSGAVDISGPFGPGWTTPFLSDYNVAFNLVTNSRPVTPEARDRYPVGLDLTWTPRGIVTFTTPSGSRHTFTSPDQNFTGGVMRALTMPGWTLERESVSDPDWVLRQPDGLTFIFDRAGRLIRYGAETENRMIAIQYPRNTLDGPAALDQPVIVTDAPNMRRLELYYDDQARIERSVLRDLSLAPDARTCDVSINCYETTYSYNERGFLSQVVYADGTRASYTYDDLGRLIGHDDPRAPVNPRMVYRYPDEGGIEIDMVGSDGTALPWRMVGTPELNEAGTAITVRETDEFGRSRSYRYAWDTGTRKAVGESYKLLSETTPLTGTSEFQTVPIEYQWDGGLLDRVLPRLTADGGRNSTVFEYTPDAQITSIRGGYPAFSVNYSDDRPSQITYADGRTVQITYDERGWVRRVINEHGGVYEYSWDESHHLLTRTSLDDDTLTAYTYNPVGLVTSVVERRLTDSDSSQWHTIRYYYDGLGRLTGIDDPLLGAYSLQYDLVEQDGTVRYRVIVVDATRTRTITLMDGLGRVAEQQVIDHEGTLLRRETFIYGEAGRLVSHTRWLLPVLDDSFTEPQSHTTRYAYEPVTILPGLESDTPVVINGYQISLTDPYGRTQRYTYDGVDRLRQVEDGTGYFIRYDYDVSETYGNTNGLRIVRREALNDRVIDTTEFVFDLRWQLRLVARNGALWEFFPEGESIRLLALRAPQNGVVEQTWSDYDRGRPTSLNVVPTVPDLRSETAVPALALDSAFDFRGRPTRITDGDGIVHALLYCPLAAGAQQIVYPEDPDQTCEEASSDILRAVTRDVHGRLVRVQDANGTRTYTYTATDGAWVVDVDFGAYTWQLAYNGAGDLIRWTDDHAITRHYIYDTLGRLRRVETENQPEASYTFTYNRADLLVSVLDDLQRGTRYAYDSAGRLAVEQDARTADATIYGYTALGQVATVISPLGSSTTYLYDDPDDPRRLTGIIEPTGSTRRFDYDDVRNEMTYTGPRGSQTVYAFDSFGKLWRVSDAAGRVHELHYDRTGQPVTWWQSVVDNQPARRIDLSYPTPDAFSVSALDWSRSFAASANGQLRNMVDGSGDALAFTYDPLGRLEAIATPGRRWTLTHAAGSPTLVLSDGQDNVRQIGFDALYRLVSTPEAAYTYEPARGATMNLSTESRVYTFVAGDASTTPRSVIVRSPGQRVTYTMNAEGLLATITTETCVDEVTEFDPLHLDDCVREQASAVWRATERIEYDAQNRPVRRIDAEQNVETYAYDDANNLSIYQDFNGRTFNYTYDVLNRLESIAGPTGIRVYLRYNALDEVSGICVSQTENDLSYADCQDSGQELETYSYDGLGRLLAQRYGDTVVSYAYNADGLTAAWGIEEQPGVAFDYDRLGVLEAITVGDDTWSLGIDGLMPGSRLLQAGPDAYTYDSTGRVQSVTIGDHRLDYTYSAAGFTITDTATGDALAFTLDGSGFLSGIGEQAQFDYFLNPDGRLLIVQMVRPDGEIIELQLNRQGETQSVSYSSGSLFMDYALGATGLVQRQRIVGLSDYFNIATAGYVIVNGYDNDNRLLTMRITAREDGDLMYLLNFTYDPLGQRETETRQYRDGTQMTIRYTYDDLNRLTRREISLSAPAMVAGAAPLAVLMAVFSWLMHTPRRRRAMFGALLLGILTPLAMAFSGAQQPPANSVSQTFTYDLAGNLTEVRESTTETVCATYSYDAANRLIALDRGDLSETFGYDLYNRVRTIGDKTLVYAGESPVLLATYDGEAPRFHAQTAARPDFYQSEGDSVVWLLNNGRNGILGLSATFFDEAAPIEPLWLFDPLGRVLTLQPPRGDLERAPCQWTMVPDLFQTISPLQVLQPDMVWDARTNLYFDSSRVYVPELGRYLQRDPLGPDVYGNVYHYPSRQTVPPVSERLPGYTDGLFALARAQDVLNGPSTLTADRVRVDYIPSGVLTEIEPLLNRILSIRLSTRDQLSRLLDLPEWLQTQYNLPGAYLDDRGVLHMAPNIVPGYGGLPGSGLVRSSVTYSPESDWLPQIGNGLDHLMVAASPPDRLLVTYHATAWQPPTANVYAMQPSLPHLPDATERPEAVMDWLPRSLTGLDLDIIEAVMRLNDLPTQSSQVWVQDALDSALPHLPDIPNGDWLDQWFSDATFGVEPWLRQRWPQLPPVNAPVVRLGPN